jgi:hypothetical protein
VNNHDKMNEMIRMYDMLERDTYDLGTTIHFDKRNLDTFGMRIYNLLFLSCNLFEIAAKEIAGINTRMNNWKKEPKIRKFSNVEMTLVQMNYKFKPLEALGEANEKDRNLTWWQGYTSVKHDITLIHNASLRNLIHALASAGLLVVHILDERAWSIQEQENRLVFRENKHSVLFENFYLPVITIAE